MTDPLDGKSKEAFERYMGIGGYANTDQLSPTAMGAETRARRTAHHGRIGNADRGPGAASLVGSDAALLAQAATADTQEP